MLTDALYAESAHTEPQGAAIVFINMIDGRGTEGILFGRRCGYMQKIIGFGLIEMHTLFVGSNPYPLPAVDMKRGHVIGAERARVTLFAAIAAMGFVFRVDDIQAVLAGHPDFAMLVHPQHG